MAAADQIFQCRNRQMRFPHAAWSPQEQAGIATCGIIAREGFDDKLGLFEAAVPCGGLRLFLIKVRGEVLKIAVLIALGNGSALQRVRRAFTLDAIAGDRDARFHSVEPHGMRAETRATALRAFNLSHAERICVRRGRRKRARLWKIFVLWIRRRVGLRYLCTRMTFGGAMRTMAWRERFSRGCLATCDNSVWTNPMNSSICFCISVIFSRMFKMMSTPARLTPISRARVRITSRRSRSWSVYKRVLPWDREGFNSPTRSYRRSVWGWSR